MENQPTEEEIKGFAAQLRKPDGEAALQIGRWMNEGNRRMNLQAFATLDLQDHEHILEVGMGNGAFVPNILRAADNVKYTGVDYSSEMVTESSSINESFVTNGSAKFMEANLEDLPLSDGIFEKAITINTFYFWDNIEQCIAEFKRVLKPEGKLFIVVRPNHILDKLPVTNYGFRKWSKDEILKELSSHKFVQIEVTHVIEPYKEGFGAKMALETLIFECTV